MMRASSFRHSLARPDGDAAGGPAPAGGPARWRRWRRLGAGVPVVLLGALLAAGCGRAPAAPGAKAIAVVVTRPITDEVADYQDFTGRLDAVKTVDIRARVSGYVENAPFKEGDLVREGDLLFQIDPRPYKAALDAAQAQLASAEAQIGVNEANLEQARVTYARARASGASATGLELDQNRAQQQAAQANLTLARANLGKAKADLDTAKLNFEWSTVRAPLDGRISRRYVDPGNLVNADNTVLTTVVTEGRLYAYFDVDERTFLDLKASSLTDQGSSPGGGPFPGIPVSGVSALGLGASSQGQGPLLTSPALLPGRSRLPVLMRLANETEFVRAGAVDFVDNRVIATTGTVRMRGVFQDPKGALKPGLFVRIRLPVGKPYPALLIPAEALLSDQDKDYVYVVKAVAKKDDGTQETKDVVEYRPVELGLALQGLRVVKKGLSEGERVIVSGMQRVRPEAQVQAKMQEPPRPPGSPLVKLLRGGPGSGK
jgi:RND family efflux transporter MFP subunit